MLLLTATTQTQGDNPGDFCHAVEGELVVIFSDCHVDAHNDGMMRCREGCPARFFGLNSNERSTTAMVRDVQVSSDDYLLAHIGYAENRGSGAPRSMACLLAGEMVRRTTGYTAGTVVGFADAKLATRSEPDVTWCNAFAGFPAMARAFAWARRYDKALEAIDREIRAAGPQEA